MRRRITYVIYGMLAIEIVGVVVFAITWNSLDFYIYWLGGHAITEGTRLYTERLAAHWFTNTPFMAALFVPLAGAPLVVVRVMWQLASVAAFAWACATTLKLSGRRVSRTTLVGVVAAGPLLEPMWRSLFLGQVNLFLLALVLADVRRVAVGRPAGVGIGIAAAIKLTPGVFIVLLLVAGRIRAACTAAGTFVCCELLAYVIAPEVSRPYWLHTFYDTSRVGAAYISNQSPYGAAVRALGGVDRVGAWYQVVPLTIGVVGLAVAVAWARRGDWLSAAAVTGATGLLVSPISWSHHWVWVVPALAVLVRDGDRVAAWCAAALFTLAPQWWTPHDGGSSEYGFHGPLTLVANSYLLAGLVFLAYMAGWRSGIRCERTPTTAVFADAGKIDVPVGRLMRCERSSCRFGARPFV